MEEQNLTGKEPKTAGEEKAKTPWQLQKESWYDKIHVTRKQLDIIIGCCIAGLILTTIAIALDAMGVF